MTRPFWPSWRSLRVRLAVLGWAAIYGPVLLLFGVTAATEEEESGVVDGVEVTAGDTADPSPWATGTAVVLAPAAAALAWWWAGRAVAPLDRVRRVAEDIGATDLGRRIALTRGPSEVVALAGGFDAMLDRLEGAAVAQRRLVEETSHELRTPLSVLATNADVLLDQPGATAEELRAGLVRSRTAAHRLQRTIDALLVEARGRARTLDRHPTDLALLVGAAVDDARAVGAARSVAVTLAAPDGVTRALDAPSVARAVANLLDNAVRHAPDGSTVEVAVDAGGVTVTDHGPGIPPEDRGRIFQRFWRGPGGAAPGAGLGLPIAAQVAEAHGGRLTVTSPGPAGDGCAFRLTLACPQPRADGPGPVSPR